MRDTGSVPAVRPRDLIVKLLAVGVALVGLTSLVSALTPDLANRVALLNSLIPIQATRTAHVIVFELGVLLIIVAFGLVRRRHRAWQLALILLAFTAVLHLAKGLDAEEAIAALTLLVLLIVKRAAFTVEGAHHATRRCLTWAGYIVGAGVLLAIASAEAVARRADNPISLREAAGQSLNALVGATDSLSALGLYTGVAIIVTAILWLRPVAPPNPSENHHRELARSILGRHAHDGLSYFSLRQDMTLTFARDHQAMLAYRVVAGVAIVSGDVIGSNPARAELLHSFHTEQIAIGRRVAAVGLPQSSCALWEQAGLMTTYIGDEAIVVPQQFSLDGRKMRKVRQSVHRIERAGYTVRIARRRDLEPALLNQLREASTTWLGGKGERGFSMALDSPWAEEHDDCVFAIALAADGSPAAYIHFVPVLTKGDLSLSTMRRAATAPNGLNEAILAAVFAWAWAAGICRVSLNFSAFGRILRSDDLQGFERLAAEALMRGDRWFQLERLDAFNRKFSPVWEPRYAACERRVDLPQAAVAILAAEGLLSFPRRRALPPLAADDDRELVTI